MRKRHWIPTGALLLILLGGLQVSADEAERFVFDRAGLLSEAEEAALSAKAGELADEYRMNFVLLTIDDAEGKDSESYADDFYMDRGFYDDGKCGGAVYLIDMDNRRVQVETAGDMKELYITDRRVEGIIDAGFEQVKNARYAEAFANMLNATAEYIEDGIVSGKYTYNEDTGEYKVLRRITLPEFLTALIAALAAGGISVGSVIGRYRLKRSAYQYPFREKSKLCLTLRRDDFVGQHISHRHIPKDTIEKSGGDSGATTTHNSSGGGNFGGGGRDF